MADEPSISNQLTQAIKSMTTTQRAVAAALVVTVLLVLAGVGILASQERMGTLFSNLPPQDANRIVDELKKQNIPYVLSQDQKSIDVPQSRVGELRLTFAGEGLPQGEGIGFDKLESPSLTTTDFTQKVMYRRAMEDELAHTIMSLQQVAQAKVHISPESDSPFATEKEEAKASVLLKLKSGLPLPEENTQAIVNLVAASVEGLRPEKVVVIDQYSRILSRSGADTLAGVSDSQKKLERQEEDHLVQQVTDLLEPVVGLGKVRATAHVDLDFDKVSSNQELYDPQGQVERETKVAKETDQKMAAGSGVPGTASNVPPATGGAAPGTTELKNKEEDDTHFEISRTVRSVEQAPGSIKHMSVAVIVDNATQWDKDPKGNPLEKQVPRTPDELKKIHDQVAAAVGFQAKRGDDLTVENLAFASISNPIEEKEAQHQKYLDLAMQFAPAVLYFILGLVVFFLVVLPLLKRVSAALNRPAPLRVRLGEAGEGGEAPSPRKFTAVKSVSEIQAEIEAELNAEGASGAPEAQRRTMVKKRIQESTASDPETIASLVRSWLIEDGR